MARRAQAVLPKKLSDEELTIRVRRYFRVREMLDSPAWKEDVLPFLEKELAAVGSNTTWRPGSGLPQLEAIALGCAYQGGAEDALKKFLFRVKTWMVEGVKAREELDKKEKRP